MTLFELFDAVADIQERGLVFRRLREQQQLSWSELFARARRRAGALQQRGVLPGDRVLVVGGNTQEVVETLLGVWLAGAAPASISPPARLSQQRHYFDEVAAKAAVCEARLTVASESLLARLRHGPSCSFEELGQGAYHRPQLDHDSLGLVQFSSGTTREPKAVALTHRNLSANVRAIVELLPGSSEQHCCVSWLPLSHDMGLIGGLLCSLGARGSLVLLRPDEFIARPLSWLQAIQEHRGTISPAPNFALAWCCQRLGPEQRRQLDLSSWSIAMVGAETVLPQTLERFARDFSESGFNPTALTPVYGLAEATLAVTFSPFERQFKTVTVDPEALATEGRARPGERSLVSLGRPLAGVELQIVDDGWKPLPEGRLGRVAVRGDSISAGYLGEEAAERYQDWLDTGDLGFLQEGELYLYSRAKDLLILSGKNHDPVGVESSLVEVEGLGRAAAFSTSDVDRGTEVLVLVAERARQCPLGPDELARLARSAVVEQTGLVPAWVHVVEFGALPVTTSGKIQRQLARRQLESGNLKPVSSC